MQASTISHQTISAAPFKSKGRLHPKRDDNGAVARQREIVVKTDSVKISAGYDLTNMTSEEMLDLAKSLYEDGNTQDFLSLAVYSARAALEDHPDPYVAHTWTTPRNENGTFNLLAEIQAAPKYSTGSSDLDTENRADREHLLHTLATLPVLKVDIERLSIDIKV